MPIIAPVSRRTTRTRIVFALMYTILTLGALTAVYPLVLMLGQSVSSKIDMRDYRCIPRYLVNDTALFRKYLAAKYDPLQPAALNSHYRSTYRSYREIDIPDPVSEGLVTRWMKLRDSLPLAYKSAAFNSNYRHKMTGPLQKTYQRYLIDRYGSLDALNNAYAVNHISIQRYMIPRTHLESFTRCMQDDLIHRDYQSFKAILPGEYLVPVPVSSFWHRHISRITGTVGELNAACSTAYTRFNDIPLYDKAPRNPVLRHMWNTFVREACPPAFVSIDNGALPLFHRWLRQGYGTVEEYNRATGTDAASFTDISWPKRKDVYGIPLADWTEFRKTVPDRYLSVRTPTTLFRKMLLDEFGAIRHINRTLGTAYADPADIVPPYNQTDWIEFSRNKNTWRYNFFTRNYREVISVLWNDTNVIPVTLLYLAGIILLQLVVNTLCAYALSRYDLPYTYKMLAFFLVTMAFPAEVTMIPDFLLLKQLGLLNTVWALTLPMAVSGYFIFILKGYFDNIPRSLYEAAQLDGLHELQIFWEITVPLSRPILAWMMLQSFMLAYSSFLFNMVVCQDRSRWTLMVWIYDMFHWSFPSMIAAASVLAAIPGIIIFLFAQRIITRGVVIPMDQ